MNLSVSILHPQRMPQILRTPMDLIRMGIWSFTVLHLMFLVPQTGFHWIGWYVGTTPTTVLGGMLAFTATSLLPVVIFIEAWTANKRAMLNKKGLVVFTLIGLIGTSLLGFGMPFLYISYLHPYGFTPIFPYLMVICGGLVGIAVMVSHQLIMRQG